MVGLSWFNRHPELFERECRIMTGLGFRLDQTIVDEQGAVVFHGPSRTDSTIQLRIVYPEAFPSLHPVVYTESEPILSTHHRPDTRELCLFGFAQRTRWHAGMTGANAVDEAEEIIRINVTGTTSAITSTVQKGEDIPEPPSDVLPYDQSMAVIVPGNLVDIPERATGTVGFIIRQPHPLVRDHRQAIVSELQIHGQSRVEAQVEFQPWLIGTRRSATLIRTNTTPGSPHDVLQCLADAGVRLSPKRKETRWFMIVFPETSGQGETMAWVLLEERDGQFVAYRCFPYKNDLGVARVPGMEELRQKFVVLAGLGTIGSRVATHLAQAGVGRLHLMDMDQLTPGNLVRFDGDIHGVGMAKVDAVRRRLLEVNPYVQVSGETAQVGAAMSKADRVAFHQMLAEADLIVDCTALHGVHRYINEIAYAVGKPTVYAWITNGSWGGEIVRVVPGETPCYVCFRHTAAMQAPSAPSQLVFPPGCTQPTFTGAGFDTAELAALAARTVVQTLLRGTGQYPDMVDHHLVWTNRDDTGCFAPSLRTESFAKLKDCYVCATP